MTATGALAVPLRSTLATHHIGENAEGDARECVKGCYSQAHTDQEPILHHRGDDVQPEHQRGGDPPEDDTAEIGRAHVCTPVTHAHLVCRLLLNKNTPHTHK